MNKSKKVLRFTATVMLVMLLLCMGTSAVAASFKARINSSSARVYNVPSTSSRVYVSGGKGVTVTVTGYSGSWARISYKGNTGYIKTKYLNLANRIKAYTAKSTPVYKQASASSGKMGTLSIGTGVYVVGKSGSYYRVQNASGSVTGYVSGGNLTTKAKLTAAYKAYQSYKKKQEAASKKPSSSSSSSSSSGSSSSGSSSKPQLTKIDKVIALALRYVGRGYAYHDNPPATFNCSSLVEYCMEYYGYSMESDAKSQAAMSNKVSKDNIKKGDVLCFDTDDDGVCDHTAIYMGSNKFVEASQSAGKVHTNDLDDWYRARLLHAIRPK